MKMKNSDVEDLKIMDIIKLEHVTKKYGTMENEVVALKDVNLSVEKGSIVSVIGASGSGKSTLLHMIGGVDIPTEGTVTVNGQSLDGLTEKELAIYRRRNVGYVFQSYQLLPVMTVKENICMPILLDHRKPDNEYVDSLMEFLKITEIKDKLPNQLSGGQKQRCAIARALANKAAILLADEPTGALDSQNSEEVMDLLKRSVKKLGQTLMLITHNQELALSADRIIKISDGRILE